MASCTKEVEPQMETGVELTNTDLYTSTSKVYTEDNQSYALVTLSSTSMEQLNIEKEKLNDYNVVIYPDKNSVDKYIKEVQKITIPVTTTEDGTEKVEPIPDVNVHYDFTNVLENNEGEKYIIFELKSTASKSYFQPPLPLTHHGLGYNSMSITPNADRAVILNLTDQYNLFSCRVYFLYGKALKLHEKTFTSYGELYGYESENNISRINLYCALYSDFPCAEVYVIFGFN